MSGIKGKKGKKSANELVIKSAKDLKKIPVHPDAVFKTKARCKKVFKAFDKNKNGYLEQDEFINGLGSMGIAEDGAMALWEETDRNKDDRVSYQEFLDRFCLLVNTDKLLERARRQAEREKEKKQKEKERKERKMNKMRAKSGRSSGGSSSSKGGKRGKKSAKTPKSARSNKNKAESPRAEQPQEDYLNGLAVTDEQKEQLDNIRHVLEALFDAHVKNFPHVDLKTSQEMSAKQIQLMLAQIATTEKEEAKRANRDPAQWAVDMKEADATNLFEFLDVGANEGTVDLGAFLIRLNTHLRRRQKNRRRAKRQNDVEQFELKSVNGVDETRDFINGLLFLDEKKGTRCAPPLGHWTPEQKEQYGAEGSAFKTKLFLSNKTKIKAIVPDGQERWPLVYATFQTEYSSHNRYTWLFHAKIYLDGDERLLKIDKKEIKGWTDGEVDHEETKDVFPEWSALCSDDEDFDEFEDQGL